MKKKEKKEKLPLISFQTFVCACCGMDSIKPFFPPFIIISIIFLVEWSFAVERWIDLVCVCG